MATPVVMPRQGQSVESCIIAKWYKKIGEPVKAGEILFSYETDKAAFDEEAKVSGTILEIYFAEGDDVPVLTNICVIGNPGESTAEFYPQKPSLNEYPAQKSEALPGTTADQAAMSPPILNQPVMMEQALVKISPRAKHLAEKTGVDYRYAVPTGPDGRIMERDIQKLLQTGPIVTAAARDDYFKNNTIVAGSGMGGRITTADLNHITQTRVKPSENAISQYEEVKLSNIRKVIANTMQHSLANTAQLTLNTSFNATNILAFRKRLKENPSQTELKNITITDMILYTVARTLLKHRSLNAHFLNERMLLYYHVHLGLAVDTERGLMVPTIMNADTKSLFEISDSAKKLAEECHKGTINPDLLQGATFTVTNLGTLGIESFTPVLNPPQTGILGVNTMIQRVQEIDGVISLYPSIPLSLTFDHRALDGAPAARFLQELKNDLANFSLSFSNKG